MLRWIWPHSVNWDTARLLALLRLPLCWSESDHTQLIGILPDCWHYSDCHCVEVNWPPQLIGILPDCWHYSDCHCVEVNLTTSVNWDTARLLALLRLPLCWSESDHTQLIGILPDCWHYSDCHCVEVNLTTSVNWDTARLLALLRLPLCWGELTTSVNWDTARLLALLRLPLCWSESDHTQLIGILPDCWHYSDCHCVEVNMTTIS